MIYFVLETLKPRIQNSFLFNRSAKYESIANWTPTRVYMTVISNTQTCFALNATCRIGCPPKNVKVCQESINKDMLLCFSVVVFLFIQLASHIICSFFSYSHKPFPRNTVSQCANIMASLIKHSSVLSTLTVLLIYATLRKAQMPRRAIFPRFSSKKKRKFKMSSTRGCLRDRIRITLA